MTEARRALHVLEAVEGGTARHVIDMASHVAGWDHHVALPAQRVGAPTDRLAARRLRAAGATVHIVDMRRTPWQPRNLAAVLALRRLITRVRPAVVHGHSSVGGALARLAATGTGVPVVYTPNALAPGSAALAVERLLGRRTARVVAVSPSEADQLRERRIAPADRIVVIPNGVAVPGPPPVIDLHELVGVAPGTPLVGSIGRLIDQKAPLRFVATCAAVGERRADVHFVLIGDGPLRRAVDSAPDAQRLGRRFHRIVELPDAGTTLGALDVFVSTARFEGGPYAPLEAMRAGTPVVLSDIVGNRDVVVDGESGFLFGEHDVAAAADRIVSLLGDPDLRRAVGEAARRRVEAHFDVSVAGRSLRRLYDDVARG